VKGGGSFLKSRSNTSSLKRFKMDTYSWITALYRMWGLPRRTLTACAFRHNSPTPQQTAFNPRQLPYKDIGFIHSLARTLYNQTSHIEDMIAVEVADLFGS